MRDRSREAGGAFFIVRAFGFELLFGFAYPGDFGVGVNHEGYAVEVDMRFLSGDALGHGHAFVAGFVRQHRAAHHVADGPNIGQIGAALAVHFDKAALVFFQADGFGVQAVGVGGCGRWKR